MRQAESVSCNLKVQGQRCTARWKSSSENLQRHRSSASIAHIRSVVCALRSKGKFKSRENCIGRISRWGGKKPRTRLHHAPPEKGRRVRWIGSPTREERRSST